MGRVTNLIICCSLGDEGTVRRIEEYRDHDYDTNLWPIFVNDNKRCYGGSKALTSVIMVAAVNWLDMDKLIAFMQKMPWLVPENVQIFFQESTENKFKVIDLF